MPSESASDARMTRTLMLVLPSALVLLPIVVAGVIALAVQDGAVRTQTEERVHATAQNLAALAQVQNVLLQAADVGTPSELANREDLEAYTAELQPLANLVEGVADVYYVVITDNEGVRITHPRQAERGEQVATTNASVLAGAEFIGTETGPSGPALRAKVPVYAADGSVIGMVSVGVLETSIATSRDAAIGELTPWLVGALIVGVIASTVLTGILVQRARRMDVLANEREQIRRTAMALREQSHEFSTRLHVIHGLVSHGDTAEALGYIEGVVPARDGHADAVPATILPTAVFTALRAELRATGAEVSITANAEVEIDDVILMIVANLCRNAAEAGASRVAATLEQRNGRVIGCVDDDGPGIVAHDVRRVFSRGYSSKVDRSGAGRGIGLDLVRRAVVGRDGTIEVARSDWGGAQFRFELAAQR